MSIQRAEELKREWTDKYIVVRDRIPELRRFEGLTGHVKTANMNCRLLIQFDSPADISWYDIDPRFVNVVEEPQSSIQTPSPKTVQPAAESKSQTTPAAEATSKVSSASPLDQIRKQNNAGDTGAPAAKPAAATTPLDAIRQQATSSTSTGSEGSPLDKIRAQAAASPSAETTHPETADTNDNAPPASTDEKAANKAEHSASPLDLIRSQNATSTKASDPSKNDDTNEVEPSDADVADTSSTKPEQPASVDTEPADVTTPPSSPVSTSLQPNITPTQASAAAPPPVSGATVNTRTSSSIHSF